MPGVSAQAAMGAQNAWGGRKRGDGIPGGMRTAAAECGPWKPRMVLRRCWTGRRDLCRTCGRPQWGSRGLPSARGSGDVCRYPDGSPGGTFLQQFPWCGNEAEPFWRPACSPCRLWKNWCARLLPYNFPECLPQDGDDRRQVPGNIFRIRRK